MANFIKLFMLSWCTLIKLFSEVNIYIRELPPPVVGTHFAENDAALKMTAVSAGETFASEQTIHF